MTKYHCHSHYETLRVDRGASPDRVRTAYRRLAQKFHPDKHAGKSAAATVMAAINQAYEVLSDPAQRAGYDDWLAAEEAQGAGPGTSVVFVPDRFGWGAWLLWAIASIAVLTVGFVMIKTMMPLHGAAASRPAPAAQPAAQVSLEPLVPARPVQPWTEPAKTILPPNPETDPVARLVRDGTLDQRPNARKP